MESISATSVVGVIARNALGSVGGIIAICSVIVLSVTTGDTALRSMRLMLTDLFHIRQDSNIRRLALAAPIFAVVIVLLIFAKSSPDGFSILWRYFSWTNQTIAVFSLAMILCWVMCTGRGRFAWVPAIPLVFYSFVVFSFILSAQIGFGLPWGIAYGLGEYSPCWYWRLRFTIGGAVGLLLAEAFMRFYHKAHIWYFHTEEGKQSSLLIQMIAVIRT